MVLNVFLIWLFIISLKALVNTILKKTISVCVCVFFFFFLAELSICVNITWWRPVWGKWKFAHNLQTMQQNYHVLKLFSKMPLVLKLDFNKIEFCVNSISSKSSSMYIFK